MTDYTDLAAQMVKALDAISNMNDAQGRFDEAVSSEVDRLWQDNAALRDELHGVANRLENLTAFVTSNPAEVAARIVTDANRGTLRALEDDRG